MKYFIRISQIAIFLFIVFVMSHFIWSDAGGNEQFDKKISQTANPDTATVAGGCFWCVEASFEKVYGVVEAVSGYAGGRQENPTYEEVSGGSTGHAESVQIIFDPYVISYSQVLDIFWKNIDPTDPGGSFYDRGSQYRSVIFYHNEQQRELAEMSKKKIESLGVFDEPIVTKIEKLDEFYRAEEYHQDFYKKDSQRYNQYRKGSGRDEFIKRKWSRVEERLKTFKKPDEGELRKILSPLQFKVTQLDGTERPFDNLYWDNKRDGIYVDIVSGEPLFGSREKYKSDTGWPSFTKPLVPDNIIEKIDNSMMMERIEVRSRLADSHLGHVFNDGPPPTGLRYCLNSAALRFIPRENLEKEGYGKYLEIFD